MPAPELQLGRLATLASRGWGRQSLLAARDVVVQICAASGIPKLAVAASLLEPTFGGDGGGRKLVEALFAWYLPK